MPGTGLSSQPLYPIAITTLAHLAVAVLDHYATHKQTSSGSHMAARLRSRPLATTRTNPATRAGGYDVWGRRSSGLHPAMTALATPLRFYSRPYFEQVAAALYGGATGRDPDPRAADAHSESCTAAVFVRLRDAAAGGERVVQSAVP